MALANFAIKQSTKRGAEKEVSFEKGAENPEYSLSLSDLSRMGREMEDVPLIAPHMDKIRVALGGIIKLCHSSFGTMHIIAHRTGSGTFTPLFPEFPL